VPLQLLLFVEAHHGESCNAPPQLESTAEEGRGENLTVVASDEDAEEAVDADEGD